MFRIDPRTFEASVAQAESKLAQDRAQVEKARLEVLQQQQQLFPAELSLVQAQLGEMLATVQLYLALGGGW